VSTLPPALPNVTEDDFLKPLPYEFYCRDTVQVAKEMLGKLLCRRTRDGLCSGRIVEVEAYLFQDDPACHARRGCTPSNRAMFGPAGRAYVYPIHSRYCLNAVSETRGVGAAVLIRAIEPISGVQLMRQHRRCNRLLDLTRGPARLCQALNIDRRLDHWDLTIARRLWISVQPSLSLAPVRIRTSSRIGISSGQDLLLRFFAADNQFVSGRRNHV
jgi:DNA-3-methyladenine glycosylase